jgi:cytochrome c oxidase assembly protein subunit 15
MKLNFYQKTAISTVGATLFLIMVGGIVRASGAGLGCPDWPKCYGLWIPPMQVSDVPDGFDLASFNALKTWTEYINRLIGVLVGFFITANFLSSIRYRKTKPSVTISSFTALVLVLFQAWLGGQVVRSGLSTGIITLHMLLAMIIVGVLLYASFKSKEEFVLIRLHASQKRQFLNYGIALGILVIIQMILGTQVREGVDTIKDVLLAPNRSLWIEELGLVYKVHRSFSWVLLLTTIAFSYRFFTYYSALSSNERKENRLFIVLSVAIPIGIVSQVLVGVGLQWLYMPGLLQVLHLIGVALLLSVLFIYLLILTQRTTTSEAFAA